MSLESEKKWERESTRNQLYMNCKAQFCAYPARTSQREMIWWTKSNFLGLFSKSGKDQWDCEISSICTIFEQVWRKKFWTLLGDTVAKVCATPRNSTWFTRPFSSWEGSVWGQDQIIMSPSCLCASSTSILLTSALPWDFHAIDGRSWLPHRCMFSGYYNTIYYNMWVVLYYVYYVVKWSGQNSCHNYVVSL